MKLFFQLSNRILITNVLKLHKLRKFVCEVCGVEYRTFKRITYHLPRCSPGPYPCNVCTLMFATQKELNYHKRKMHKFVILFFSLHHWWQWLLSYYFHYCIPISLHLWIIKITSRHPEVYVGVAVHFSFFLIFD